MSIFKACRLMSAEGGYAARGDYDAGGGRVDRRRTDFGLLNDVVLIRFLNFSLGVFALCVLLMVVVSKGGGGDGGDPGGGGWIMGSFFLIECQAT